MFCWFIHILLVMAISVVLVLTFPPQARRVRSFTAPLARRADVLADRQ